MSKRTFWLGLVIIVLLVSVALVLILRNSLPFGISLKRETPVPTLVAESQEAAGESMCGGVGVSCVRIVAPLDDTEASNKELTTGKSETVSVVARIDGGVKRIELWIDGEMYDSEVPPQGRSRYGMETRWTPAEQKTYHFEARAYSAGGTVFSDEANVTVSAKGEHVIPTGTPVNPADSFVSGRIASGRGCIDDALLVAEDPGPGLFWIERGTAFTARWKLRNIGTCSWGTGYRLVFDGGSQLGSEAHVEMPGVVLPGGEVWLEVDMVSPQNDGPYESRWQMRNPPEQGAESGQRFGPTLIVSPNVGASPTPTPTHTPKPTLTATPTTTPSANDAQLVDIDYYPDTTSYEAGESVRAELRVKNTGDKTWSGYTLRFVSGDRMDAYSTIDVPYTTPGNSATISIDLRAPDDSGTYRGKWRLADSSGNRFGPEFSIELYVETCYDAVSYSDTWYDLTVVAGGEMDFRVVVKNTGTCTWDDDYRLYAYLEAHGVDYLLGYQEMPVLYQGSETSIRVREDVPDFLEEGYYNGYLEMKAPDGTAFGPVVQVRLRVTD